MSEKDTIQLNITDNDCMRYFIASQVILLIIALFPWSEVDPRLAAIGTLTLVFSFGMTTLALVFPYLKARIPMLYVGAFAYLLGLLILVINIWELAASKLL